MSVDHKDTVPITIHYSLPMPLELFTSQHTSLLTKFVQPYTQQSANMWLGVRNQVRPLLSDLVSFHQFFYFMIVITVEGFETAINKPSFHAIISAATCRPQEEDTRKEVFSK